MHAISVTHPYLPTFTHAADALADLVDAVPRFVGVAAVCDAGWAHDLTLFTGADARMDAALDWAWCVAANDLDVTGLVLLSSEERLDTVREADLEWFGTAADELGSDGLELTDWVRTDGDRIRSTAQVLGLRRPSWLA